MARKPPMHPKAAKELKTLAKGDAKTAKLFDEALSALAKNPTPPGSKKLEVLPGENVYRVYVTYRYRIIYQIRSKAAYVLHISSREGIDYKKLGGRVP